MVGEVILILLMFLSGVGPVATTQKNVDSGLGSVKGVETVREVGAILHSHLFFHRPRMVKNSTLNLEAQSFFLMDESSHTTLARSRAEEKMPIASLTKIMTAVVVLENKDLEEIVTISEKATNTYGNKRGLVKGEQIKVKDLLEIMLIDSNNAAAVALAEHTGGSTEGFVKMMNSKAAEMGLVNTKFINPTGLDEGENHNFSTAYEIAILSDYAFDKNLVWDFTKLSSAVVYSIDGKQVHSVKSTNQLLGEMAGVVGGKTGYTDEAGGCLVIIAENENKRGRVIGVVLDSEDRFLAMKNLINWSFDVYSW